MATDKETGKRWPGGVITMTEGINRSDGRYKSTALNSANEYPSIGRFRGYRYFAKSLASYWLPARDKKNPASDRSENSCQYWSNALPPRILLVEDSPGDVRLTREAFRSADIPVALHVVFDGQEALAFLKREVNHPDAPRPDLILLDLNIPKVDGREVLACIKEDADLSVIPIIILTTSDATEDITACYQLKANCYLTKPVHFDEFEVLVKSVADFWLTKATLPPQ
jgi:two-component system, chemotaxis family, response regulator Rcp1